MDIINGILLGGTLCLIAVLLLALWQDRQQKKTVTLPLNLSVSLDQLSRLWAMARESGKIKIDDLAPIWRDPKNTDKEKKNYSFKNKKIKAFFDTHINQAPWFGKAPLQKEVCYRILLLLEGEGDCPSVVNAANDVEASWDSNTYSLLGKTTLLEHTLNVALEAIKLLQKEEANHVIPDTMVAVLGHDLGKLPSIRGHLYSLGEHPLAAGRVLAGIAAFKQLVREKEISRAIKLHHKRPEGLLGKTLKKADQLARQKELEQRVEQLAGTTKQTGKGVQPKSSSKGPDAPWQAQADIYGEEEPISRKKVAPPQRIDIATWFDAQDFLDRLKPYINRLTGRRFLAFSMANGYVYFQAKAIEEVTRKQAEQAGAMDIATMAADDPTMRQVLFTVVDHLRVEHGVIARELIKDQYFGGYFTIATGGSRIKGFYTPFHAESFGSIAEMEQKKTGILKNFKSVDPYLNKPA